MPSSASDERLSGRLLMRVLDKLQVSPSTDFDGLSAVYASWCRSVPFDNIRKMTAMCGGAEGELPGLDAEDFFEHWLETGSGGTCWPSSNALCVLLNSIGLKARRSAGAMYDADVINHGTVKVKLDGFDWLVDTSILSNSALPLSSGLFIGDDPAIGVEIEHQGDSILVWADYLVLPYFLPFRLSIDPAGMDLYRKRYSFSRQASPFNQRIYVRSTCPENALVIYGNTLYRRTASDLEISQHEPDEICGILEKEIGISHDLIKEWLAVCGTEAVFEPRDLAQHPPIDGVRPSLRKAAAL